MKFGNPLPAKGEENFNPNAPELHNDVVLYALRDRRFKAHKNAFQQQKMLVLVCGAGFGDF